MADLNATILIGLSGVAELLIVQYPHVIGVAHGLAGGLEIGQSFERVLTAVFTAVYAVRIGAASSAVMLKLASLVNSALRRKPFRWRWPR